MPVARVAPGGTGEHTDADGTHYDEIGHVGKAKIKGKAKAKKEAKERAKRKSTKKKEEEDPFGDPYDPEVEDLPLGARHFVEFHERSSSLVLSDFAAAFGSMLPREQMVCFQRLILFQQKVGRMIARGPTLAAEFDYASLLEKLRVEVTDILNVKRVRIFGVDYNSLGLARGCWLVAGETGMLGASIAIEEWAGVTATGPPAPHISLDPTSSTTKYGMGYVALDTQAKFDCKNLCSVALRMRDSISSKVRPRYVLEAYNKVRPDGKTLLDFDETDAYIAGCLARTCGAAIAWVLGNRQQQQIAEFSAAVLGGVDASDGEPLRRFSTEASKSLCSLFNCEEAVIFWVDETHSLLWRYKTEDELRRDSRINKRGDKEMVPFDVVSLATEAMVKVNMSGAQEQFVLNTADAPAHPKFNADVDQKVCLDGHNREIKVKTRNLLSVPIARRTSGHTTLAVVQLRNKLETGRGEAVKNSVVQRSVFRTDDLTFLQHFAVDASPAFEQAWAEHEACETVDMLDQARVCVSSVIAVAHKLSMDLPVDDLFPLVVSECLKTLGCERATLFLRSKETTGANAGKEFLWSKISHLMPPIVVPLKKTSIAGATVLDRTPANIQDVYRDSRFDPTFDRKSGFRTRSLLCVPIRDSAGDKGQPREHCIGCIQALNKMDRFKQTQGVAFNQKDLDLLDHLCHVVSIAIARADSSTSAHGSTELAVNVTTNRSASLTEAQPDRLPPAPQDV